MEQAPGLKESPLYTGPISSVGLAPGRRRAQSQDGRPRNKASRSWILPISFLLMAGALLVSFGALNAAPARADDGHTGLTQEQESCITSIVGYMPSNPEDLTEEQLLRVGQECFDQTGGIPVDENQDAREDVERQLQEAARALEEEQRAAWEARYPAKVYRKKNRLRNPNN